MVKPKLRHKFSWLSVLLWFVFAIVVAIADQWVKDYMQHQLIVGDVQKVTEFFNLTMAYNSGAAFSLLANAGGWQREFFSTIAFVATIVISFLIGRNAHRFWFCLGLALIMGGALGNAFDRVTFGMVIDYLDFHAMGYHWPAFNLADTCICTGFGLVILTELLQGRKG